ncbi:MAG: hypothetical protein ACXW1W_06295 [Methylococcaceae bacterium]
MGLDSTNAVIRGMVVTKILALKPDRLSKSFALLTDGSLQKNNAGQLAEGTYETLTFKNVTEFAEFLPTLKNNEALSYGRPVQTSGKLMSKQRKADTKDTETITRSRECFDWPKGAAVFLGDSDPAPGAIASTTEQIRSTLCEVMPELADVPMILWHSASSHIYNKNTEVALKGAGGVRVYIVVADGRDIPRFGDVLFKQLWLKGHGFYVCSKSGALLPRSLLDASVWQPERLDFAAGAYIAEHELIEQRRPAPQIFNPDAEPFNTSSIPDLSNEEKEQLVGIQTAEREVIKPEQRAVREKWINDRLEGVTDEKDREYKLSILENAVLHRKLFADYELIARDGSRVTVGEIMDNPDKWHNQYLKDPLEPDYNGGSNVSWLNLKSGGKPYLHSHAHGGTTYTLYRQTTTIKVAGGELPRVLSEISIVIAMGGETFQRGGVLVRIVDNGILTVTQPWLKNHIEESISFLRWDARKKNYTPCDSPPELATRYIHNRGAWEEPELAGLLNGPIFRLDGTLLDAPGYDKKTGLLLRRNADQFYPVSRNPTTTELYEAFKVLWEPFALFPFVGPDDASGALAAMLTAIQRPVLPTAPAFGANAYVAGSGKSYVTKAISWLSGNEPSEMPWSNEPEEQRKRLTAALLAGRSSVLIDNLNGMLDSDTLCSILTSESYEDRKLGVSENLNLSTRTLFLVTGNNLTVIKDLCRRVIVSTIDHGMERPSKLAFPFNPVARVRENWLKYRTAGLTILSAYIAAGSPRMTNDSVGSFEVWDSTIRQCILWLSGQDFALFYEGVPELGDPVNLLEQSYENDPELERLEEYLNSWHKVYTDQEKTIADVMRDAGLNFDGTNSSIREELLIDISGGNKPNSRAIAAFMRRNKGRPVNGLVIRKGLIKSDRQLWSVLKK